MMAPSSPSLAASAEPLVAPSEGPGVADAMIEAQFFIRKFDF